MNILIVTNMYPSDKKNSFGIFVKEQVDSYRLQFPDDDIHVFSFSNGNYAKRYFLSSFSLLKYLALNKVDIIHVHFGLTFLPLLLSLPLCFLKKIKIVTAFHGSDVLGNNPITKFVTQLAILFSNVAIGVSQQICRKLSIRHKKVEYIPCGVTKEFYQLSQDIHTEKLNKVIFPSSPSRVEKNYPMFERITNNLAKELEGNIKFETVTMEGLSREEVVKLFKSSACLLLTSEYEGSPQVIKEAIICDLPIVSTAVGDVPMLLAKQKLAVVSSIENELYLGLKNILLFEKSYDGEYSFELKKSVMNDVAGDKLREIYKNLAALNE